MFHYLFTIEDHIPLFNHKYFQIFPKISVKLAFIYAKEIKKFTLKLFYQVS